MLSMPTRQYGGQEENPPNWMPPMRAVFEAPCSEDATAMRPRRAAAAAAHSGVRYVTLQAASSELTNQQDEDRSGAQHTKPEIDACQQTRLNSNPPAATANEWRLVAPPSNG